MGRSRWDSNPQPLAPKANALSIAPRDPMVAVERTTKLNSFTKFGSHYQAAPKKAKTLAQGHYSLKNGI